MDQILDTVQLETKPVVYAGFWLRVGAAIIDGIIIWVVQTILTLLLFGAMSIDSQNLSGYNVILLVIFYMIVLVLNWVYYAGMESSARQGTSGKIAVGVKVTDLNGDRIGFANATGRYFSKIISAIILFIGFLMVAFTEKKQGLHDQIAGTLVVKK